MTAAHGQKKVGKWSPKRFFHRLTTRFIILYVVLMFIPTVSFIAIYSNTLAKQVRNESQYKEQLMLNQTAAFLSSSLSGGEAIINSFQTENMLLNLLEGSYGSASEELLACVTYVQPMMSSILATNPLIRDIFVYRYHETFLTNSDMVFNLPMISEFPYGESSSSPPWNARGFLAVAPDLVRHWETEAPVSSQYVFLIPIYNRGFNKVAGLLEVQMDMDRALTALELAVNGGRLYVCDEGVFYPVVRAAGGAHLDWRGGAMAPSLEEYDQMVSAPVEGTTLSLLYAYRDAASANADRERNVVLAALILLLPTSIVCAYVFQIVSRLVRFGQHIRAAEESAPMPFLEKAGKDELGDVIREYNAMAATIEGLIAQVTQVEQLKNAATYYAMSSQVNPHFMFNTLENIRMQIEMERYEDASRMLFVLGRFLRYNISLRRESVLKDELTHIENYLMIYRYRVQNLIDFSIKAPETLPLESIRCPFCMLQPIVENCLKHGIRDGVSLTIAIEIREEGENLLVTVTDNGTGMPKEDIDAMNESFLSHESREEAGDVHVGLGNVNARLKYFFGHGYGLRLISNEPVGLIAQIRIAKTPKQNAPGAQ